MIKIILFVTIMLAGCASSEQLVTPKGPIFPLNAGRWMPTTWDLRTPAPVGTGQ